MDSLLHRWADGVMVDYELDDKKRADVRDAVVRRWSGFLNENRSKIQPLLNEFIEMRVAVDPPAKGQVQAWARRAMPVFGLIRRQLTEGMDDFRQTLDPVQRAKFEREALELGVATQVVGRKLERWQEGKVDIEEFWARPNAQRRERRQERRHRRAERAKKKLALVEARRPEVDQIALELQAWDKYVKEFIQTHTLDDGQRTAALSCLSELKERAAAHRDRRRPEIDELERRIRSNTGSDQELADIKQQLIELYGPIDEMFKELQGRLEQIPTAKQRATAREPEQKE